MPVVNTLVIGSTTLQTTVILSSVSPIRQSPPVILDPSTPIIPIQPVLPVQPIEPTIPINTGPVPPSFFNTGSIDNGGGTTIGGNTLLTDLPT